MILRILFFQLKKLKWKSTKDHMSLSEGQELLILCLLSLPKYEFQFPTLNRPLPLYALPSLFINLHTEFLLSLSLSSPVTAMAALGSRISSTLPSSSPHLRTHRGHSTPRPISSSLHFSPSHSSSSSSPFTEKHSTERYSRDSWLYKGAAAASPFDGSLPFPYDSDSIRRNDIALQLPELKNLLQVLREKRRRQHGCDGTGEQCRPGNVYLVGTGPGDPELLTLKAVRVIKEADLLLYDRLVSHDVLDLVGPDARLLYVGKTAGYHSRTQVKCGCFGYSFCLNVCSWEISSRGIWVCLILWAQFGEWVMKLSTLVAFTTVRENF